MKVKLKSDLVANSEWVRTVVSEISIGNYKKALKQFERWAEKAMSAPSDRATYETARGVYVILNYTEWALERDFEVRWRRRNSKKTSDESCGFCGRSRQETTHLLAGAQAYICDSCVKECSQVVKDLKRKAVR